MTEQPGDPSPATAPEAPARRMTPEAALGRHVEWLEFALAAARSEETWRVARLDRRTNATVTGGRRDSTRSGTRSRSSTRCSSPSASSRPGPRRR